jgi:hypothetical protein
MHKKSLLPLLFAVCISFQSGFAQWTTDSTTYVRVCQVTNDQKYPEMVTDGTGGTIIAWQDARDGSTKIYAQRLDSSGIPKWTTNGVVISTATDSKIPNLTSDGVGGAIITWFDLRNGWPNGCVAVQRVNANGDPLWQANGISLADSASAWAYPEITGYGTAGAIVTWIGKNGEVYTQKIDTSGAIQWTSGGVLLDLNGSTPHIIPDNSGGAFVAWYSYNAEHTNTDIFAQHIGSDGVVTGLSTGDSICCVTGYQQNPRLVSDGSGGAIISWIDHRTENENYPYAQRVGAGGEVLWAKNGLQIATTNAYYRIPIVSDGTDGAIFTWLGGNSADVYVQRINGNGTPQWTSDVRLTVGTSPSIPSIISDGATGAFVLWENPGEGKVKLQHVNSDGTLSFGPAGKTVSMGSQLYGYYALCTDGVGRAIVAWEDTPSYTTDIYAERVVVPDFTTGVSESGLTETAPREFALSQNFPNPFNPTTTITFTLAEKGHALLKVFDVLGREVATLVDAQLNAGELHRATFDASRLSTGIYYYRLETEKNVLVKKLMLVK